MDLAWSAKDQYLATCSVDNTVIIWNALKFPGKKHLKVFLVYLLNSILFIKRHNKSN